MDTLTKDLRYAVRGLVRTPGFTIAVVVTLALGIGANTTMFGVLDTLLLKPPAYVRDASRVQRLYFRSNMFGRNMVNSGTSFPVYQALAGVRAFSAAAAVAQGHVSIGTGVAARPASVRAVSASFFPLLGVHPELGRFFDSTDDQLGAGPVLVVSHRYWQRDMAGDPDVLHRTIQIGQFLYSIVGVAPAGFTGADLEEPDLWLPIRQAVPLLVPPQLAAADALGSGHWFWLSVLARLAPSATRTSAMAEAQVAYDREEAANNATFFAGPGPGPGGPRMALPGGGAVRRMRPPPLEMHTTVLLGPIQAARGPDMSSDTKVALWVAIVALAVLLVACANVGNLLLARGLRRRVELAVRAGLGAGRGALVRQLVVESMVLALAGGAAGLLVALWGGSVVRAYLLPAASASSLFDSRILLFTLGVALVAGLLSGSAPAWQVSRGDLASALRSGGHDVNPTRGVLRSALLVTQVALTLVLLVGAGLFVRSLRHAESLDYGLDLDHLLIANANLHVGGVGQMRVMSNQAPAPGSGGPTDPQSAAYLRLEQAIKSNPAVAGAAVSMGTPFQSAAMLMISVSGRDSLPRAAGGGPMMLQVSPGYFPTVGTKILRGRGFTDADVQGATPVAVVGERFAQFAWPGKDPIGQCIYLGPVQQNCIQVVGVAADARTMSVTQDKPLLYYLPFAEHLAPMPLDGLLIRTRRPAREAAGEIQHALQAAEPDLPFVAVEPMLDRVEPQWRSWQLGATMLSVFGLLALVIASLGLYGVTAYGVTQRTREIGVRIALGAGGKDVVRLAVMQAVRATAIGGAIGLLVALALARALSSLLFGVKPLDPASLGAAIVVLLAVAALAAWLPARRAAAVDPMEALRTE